MATKQIDDTMPPEERRVARQFFAGYVAALRPARGDMTEAVRDGTLPIQSLDGAQATARQILGEYSSDVEVVYREGVEQGAEVGRVLAVDRFGLDVVFDEAPPQIIESLDDWATSATDDVLTNLGDDAGAFLRGVHEEGLSVPDAAERLQNEFWDDRVEGHRAERVIRTEVNGSSNAGQQSAYVDAPSVVAKQWTTALDGRQRDTHGTMHQQAVKPEANFTLPDGQTAPHPGHFGLSPDERVNCRCTHVPVFRDQLTDSQFAQLQAGRQIEVVL